MRFWSATHLNESSRTQMPLLRSQIRMDFAYGIPYTPRKV